ncbi:MAG: hypothetical protein JWQ38_3487 [Flavipsychrobacter sp.]|nr:hypothetical protein [Flavipsychrobacter sp.]
MVKAVTAGFTVDNSAGCAPLVVNFTNTSTGATSFFWDLGNGTTSTLKNVSGSYTAIGTYTAKLTATNGGTSVTYSMTITVYPPPIVSFYANDTSVCPGTAVTFYSTSTTGGSPGPMTYIWNFGDGTISTLPTPTHAYTSPGFYKVTLSVATSMGCMNSLAINSYMHVFNPPVASFTGSPTKFCTAPATVTFKNFSTGPPSLSYAWAFGDGGSSSSPAPTHTYALTGSFSVTLIVTDGNGCQGTSIMPAYVNIGHVTAGFTMPATACAGSNVGFTNTTTPTPSTNKWSFGDGGTSTLYAVNHTYTAPGTYTVKLVASDGTCPYSVTHTITINPLPTAIIGQSSPQPCPPPTNMTFTGTVSPGTTVSWKFGDGTTGSGNPVSHVYTKAGIDTITMTVTNPITGCVSTSYVIDTFFDMTFDMLASPLRGCNPLTVNFDITAMTTQPNPSLPAHPYPYPFTSYSWNFGDGSLLSSVPKPSHTYTAAGIYKATVTVVSKNGCVFMDTVTITVSDPPVITASATPTHICYGNSVHIPITVLSGLADTFIWTFSGGISPVIKKTGSLDIKFPLPGIYTCTVTASYRGCFGAPYVIPISIIVDSPIAVMKWAGACSPRNTINFFDNSLGDDTHLWIFGDGTTSTLKNPTHAYPYLGTFTVVLATYNIKSGCRDTTTDIIDLSPTVFDFTVDHPTICRDDVVNLTPFVIVGAAKAYTWYLNGVSYGPGDPITHVLSASLHGTGIYDVRLVISDQLNCLDTLTKTSYIQVAKPVAHITLSPTKGCAPLPVLFTDASTDIPGATLNHFDWTFGDGGSASLTVPTASHTYITGGTITVTEIVTDNFGCKDTTKTTIVVTRPNISFSASTLFPCLNIPAVFTNHTPLVATALWDFGDGTTSTLISPSHIYTATGTYTVKLHIVDMGGCIADTTAVSCMHVAKPTADFNMTDSFSICPPITVTFFNTSSGVGALGYDWFFGDGNSSTLYSPSNLYLKPGHDTVTLTVTDANGCTDTKTRYMDIFGYAGAFSYGPLTGCAPWLVNFKSTLSNVPNIIWDFADGIIAKASNKDTISHVYEFPGAYVPKLILSDNTGCENSSVGIDTIKVDAVSMGFTTVPSPVCENVQVYLKDTSFSYFSTVNSWMWVLSDGATSTLRSPTFLYTKAGTYEISLRVSDGWGCADSGKQQIIVYPPPVITTSPDSIICLTDAATLTGYGGATYTWEAPSTLSCTACNPTFASPLVVTTYTVTGTDIHGCKNTNTVTVRLKTKTVSTGHGDTAVCYGVVVPLWDSGANKFNWIPAEGLNDHTSGRPIASPERTTNYMCIAQLASCIPDTNFVLVTVYPGPMVDAGPDQTIVAGMSADLRAAGTDIASISWGHDSTLSCDGCMTPRAIPFQTTAYVIHVKSSFGCPNTDTVVIHLYCDKGQVFVPNTFTPNGDGENDVFYPRGRGISIVKSFRIYNRWGQLLFERSNIQLNDATNAWDGSYMNDMPRPDVYVYVVEAVCNAGTPINIKGDVTIIR